jgi:hypothetical protein
MADFDPDDPFGIGRLYNSPFASPQRTDAADVLDRSAVNASPDVQDQQGTVDGSDTVARGRFAAAAAAPVAPAFAFPPAAPRPTSPSRFRSMFPGGGSRTAAVAAPYRYEAMTPRPVNPSPAVNPIPTVPLRGTAPSAVTGATPVDSARRVVQPPGPSAVAAATTPAPEAPLASGRGDRRLSAADDQEVIKVQIPSPTLEFDEKTPQHLVTRRVRAFIRDAANLFGLASWGHSDPARCLFLANAFKGVSKTWHDDWTLSRRVYTSDALLDALQARFAPEILSRDSEARIKLARARYCMRQGETVSAYQTRFESILSDIPDITESERIFWFQAGLSVVLSGSCAADHIGRPFTSYDTLVLHTKGEELRIIAAKRSRSALHLNSVTQDDDDMDADDAIRVKSRGKRQRQAPSANTTGAGGSAGAGPSSLFVSHLFLHRDLIPCT